jgi:hypothetical protein
MAQLSNRILADFLQFSSLLVKSNPLNPGEKKWPICTKFKVAEFYKVKEFNSGNYTIKYVVHDTAVGVKASDVDQPAHNIWFVNL